jgi:DNA-directed RNA polymerase subunit F
MPKRVKEQEEDANLALFGSLFQNTQTLLLSEVKVFLEIFRDQERSKGQEMQEIMTKTLEYCAKFSKFSNKATVKEIRKYVAVLHSTCAVRTFSIVRECSAVRSTVLLLSLP